MTLLISTTGLVTIMFSLCPMAILRSHCFDGMHAYADRCVWAVLEKN